MPDIQKFANDFLIRLYLKQGYTPQQAATLAMRKLAGFDPMRAEINRVDNDPLRGDPLWAPGSLQGDWIARAEEERRAQAARPKPVLPGYDTQPRFDIAGPPAFQSPPFVGEEARAEEYPPFSVEPPPRGIDPPFAGEEARADERRAPPPPVFVGEEARADETPRNRPAPVPAPRQRNNAPPLPAPVAVEATQPAPVANQAVVAGPSLLAGPADFSRRDEAGWTTVGDYFRLKKQLGEQGLLGRGL